MPQGDILVVDDNPDIAAMISDVLRDEGYTIPCGRPLMGSWRWQRWRRTTWICYSSISTSRACRV